MAINTNKVLKMQYYKSGVLLTEAKFEKNKSAAEKQLIRNTRFIHTGEEPDEDLTDVVGNTSPDEITAMRRNAHELERGEKKIRTSGNRSSGISRALLNRHKEGRHKELRRNRLNRLLAVGKRYTGASKSSDGSNTIRRIQREEYKTFGEFIAEAKERMIQG